MRWPWTKPRRPASIPSPQEALIPPDLDLRFATNSAPRELSCRFEARDPNHVLHLRAFDWEYQEDLPRMVTEKSKGIFRRPPGEPPEEAEVRLSDLGALLADLALPEELREALRGVGDEVQNLRILADSFWLPWEIFKLDSDPATPFLAERFALTRWHPGCPEHIYLPLHEIRTLIPEADSLSRSDAEGLFLKDLGARGRSVRLVASRLDDVRKALEDATVDGWHFCGHAMEQDPQRLTAAQLVLGPRQKFPQSMFCDGLLRHAASAPLIFFNACHTASTRGMPGVLRGWDQLLDAGAGAFIGASGAIRDESALTFAQSFYSNFLAGIPLGEAIRRARLELRRKFPGDPTRLAYVAYAHPRTLCCEPLAAEHDSQAAMFYQECFALYRVVTNWEAGGTVLLREPEEERQALEVILSSPEESDERWILHTGARPLQVHLRILREARNRQRALCLLGTVQNVALDRDLGKVASLLETVRCCAVADISSRHVLFASPSVPEKQCIEALLSEDGLEAPSLRRFHLIGLDLPTLQLRILERLNHQAVHRPLAGISLNNMFAYRAGPALTLLRRGHGQEIPCSEILSLLQSPTVDGAEQRNSVDEINTGLEKLHAANLHRTTQPLGGRTIHVEDLYVAPRGRLVPRVSNHLGNRAPAAHIGSTETIDDLGTWLYQEVLESNRPFTLILGDFGLGKTTLLQRLAAELSRRRNEHRFQPVYLTLRDYSPDSPLQDLVALALARHLSLTKSLWEESEWILLLDGFDELDILHRADSEGWIQYRFWNILQEAQRANVRIVLSSRPILFLDPNLKQHIIENLDHLEMLPFDRRRIGLWLENWSRVESPLCLEDLARGNLLEVAETPVLLMMIAMMLGDGGFDASPRNRGEIYDRFFEWTSRRGGMILHQHEAGRLPPKKHLVPENYREILREIAWLLTYHPDANSGLLHHDTLLAEIRERFGESPLLDRRLFVAHAFREEKPRQIEFQHQSLREYLTAEKLFQAYTLLGSRGHPSLPTEVWTDQVPSGATLRFFREQIEIMPAREQAEHLNACSKWSSWPEILTDLTTGHLPAQVRYLRLVEGKSKFVDHTLQVDRAVAVALLLEFLFELYLRNTTGCFVKEFLARFQDIEAFLGSTSRFQGLDERFRHSWAHLSLVGLQASGVDFSRLHLIDGTIEDCRFQNCRFQNTDFSGTRIAGPTESVDHPKEPTFAECSFDAVAMGGVTLEGVVFRGCLFERLGEASGTEVSATVFQQCHFKDSVLPNAMLCYGRFIECSFERTKIAVVGERLASNWERCIVASSEGWRDPADS